MAALLQRRALQERAIVNCDNTTASLKRARDDSSSSCDSSDSISFAMTKRLKSDLDQVYVVTRGEIHKYFSILGNALIYFYNQLGKF